MDDCLEVCMKSNGCELNTGETHKVCKNMNLINYEKLNKLLVCNNT